MPSRKVVPSPPTHLPASSSIASRREAEVFVDFVFDRGLLFVAVENASDIPAYQVGVVFDEPFRGLGGACEVSSLALFRCIEFLAPHKRIQTFLDSSGAYFERGEPTRIGATITYSDHAGDRHTRRVVHDLVIYRDLAYVVGPAADADRLPPGPTVRPPSSATGTHRHGNPQG